MANVGDNILINKGIFSGQKGEITNSFKYNERDIYAVHVLYKGKSNEEKYVTTVSNGEFSIVD